MYWYVRVIEKSSLEHTLEDFLIKLNEVVERLDGVYLVKPPEVHLRGGYSLYFDCETDHQPEIIEQLILAGFLPCY